MKTLFLLLRTHKHEYHTRFTSKKIASPQTAVKPLNYTVCMKNLEADFSSGSQKLLSSPVRCEMKYNCLTASPCCDNMREDY